MTATIDLSDWLTTAEAARRLRLSLPTVRRMARDAIAASSQEVAVQHDASGRVMRILVSPAWLRSQSGTVRGRWAA